MARRWKDPAAFLADPTAAPASRPTRRQALALICVLVLVAAGSALVSWLLKPSRAQAFNLFRGSIYINDQRAPVSVDLASGKPTVRLRQANEQVGSNDPSKLSVYPLSGGTLLLNTSSGEFNMVDSTGFVIKLNGGVPLPPRASATSAQGVAAGDRAYIVRSGGGTTDIYLVGPATVQTASAPGAHVVPRAFRTVPSILAPGVGSVASANGDLWAITGTGQTNRLWHLVLPRGSNNGVPLSVVSTQPLSGLNSIGVTTRNGDGSGGDVVAVASANRIRLIQPSGSTSTVTFPAIAGLDTLLPATNQHGRATFLYHATSGWGIVSVRADGGHLEAPRPLAVDAGANLARPAASLGSLYTMDRVSGDIFRIGDKGQLTTVTTYPLARVEARAFDDTYLVARGPRVIVDSPNHIYALTLFTDGSSMPVRIDKTAAVDVNAAGAVDAIAKTHGAPRTGHQPPQKNGRAPEAPTQPINNAIDCTKTTQVPHVPTITTVDPGSRSVHLEWTYTKLDLQDCIPSTYTLSVRLISADAPQPPGTATVQGQTSVNLTGLFPSTQYSITLTAYINGRGTSAQPVTVTTGPEGPAAPTNVHATTTSNGDWVITWQSCGGVLQGCVPATSWDVLPSFCDGLGLSNAPAPLSVRGDPTLHSFTATFPGGGALLGRALTFIVQGRGVQDTKGTPSQGSACAQSWTPPIAADISINASIPPSTTVGGTSATTVTVNLGSEPQAAIGGLGGTVTFMLAGPNGTTTKAPITYDGSSAILSTTFTGLQTGATYHASALVAPPAHASAAVTIGPTDVVARAAWPAFTVAASCPSNNGPIKLTCQLSVTLSGPSSSAVNGETFDLTDQSRLQCGQRALSLSKSGFDPANDPITATVSLLSYSGDCTVYIQLIESSSDPDPTVFDRQPSDIQTGAVTLGQPSTLDATAADFDAAWSSRDGSSVAVQYVGSTSDSDIAAIATNWRETILAPDGTSCGNDNQDVSSRTIYVDPTNACINKFGSQPNWSITISYDDTSSGTTHTITKNLAGTPPGYVPCSVNSAQFSGSWNGSHPNPVGELSFSGNDNDLSGCSNWSYALIAPDSSTCNTLSGQAPSSKKPVDIPVNCSANPSSSGWTIKVQYQNPDNSTATFTVPVVGSPP